MLEKITFATYKVLIFSLLFYACTSELGLEWQSADTQKSSRAYFADRCNDCCMFSGDQWCNTCRDCNCCANCSCDPTTIICPWLTALSPSVGNTNILNTYRAFRDNYLVGNNLPKLLGYVYYRNGSRVANILSANPVLSNNLSSLIVNAHPIYQNLVGGNGSMLLTNSLINELNNIIQQIEIDNVNLAGGTLEKQNLQEDISYLRTKININSFYGKTVGQVWNEIANKKMN